MTIGKKITAAVLSGIVLLFAAAPATLAGEEIVGRANLLLAATGTPGACSAESTLGLVAADAVRTYAGADVAIVNGGDLHADIPAGKITRERVLRVFADDRPVSTAEVTPAQLCAILEAGVSHVCLDLDGGGIIDYEASAFDGFPQVSGMSFQYDASAPPGERILSVAIDGQALSQEDDITVFVLAATDSLLSGGYDSPAVSPRDESEFTLSEAFFAYLEAFPDGVEKPGSRITVIGAGTSILAELGIPSRSLGILLMVFLLCFGFVKCRREKTDENDF